MSLDKDRHLRLVWPPPNRDTTIEMVPLDSEKPADVARLREVITEAEYADGRPPVSDQALIAGEQGRRRLRAFTENGAVVAVGIAGEGELDLVVRPSARGALIGSDSMALLLHELDHEELSELTAWSHGHNPAAEALLRRAKFKPVRTLLRMSLDPAHLDAAVDAARAMPGDYTVRAFDPGNPHDIAEWVRVNAAAFASHPEQGRMTAEDVAHLMRESWFDPSDLVLAFEASETRDASETREANRADTAPGRLAGYTWVKTVRHREGDVETELYALGVHPDHAGRGLGAGLLGETLTRMRAHNPDTITLFVDDDNANARALYERAGFEIDQVSRQWHRAIPQIA